MIDPIVKDMMEVLDMVVHDLKQYPVCPFCSWKNGHKASCLGYFAEKALQQAREHYKK